MIFKIGFRWQAGIKFEADVDSMELCIKAAQAAGVNLSGSDLSGSNLSDSNLRGSNLSDSDLRGSDLRGSNLTPIRDDFWAVLSAAPMEVPALIEALKAGKVNGSTYTGECACLVGTIANARKCDYQAVPGLVPNSNRPAEMFFMAIKPGDVPGKNAASKLAVEWATEWLERMKSAFAVVK